MTRFHRTKWQTISRKRAKRTFRCSERMARDNFVSVYALRFRVRFAEISYNLPLLSSYNIHKHRSISSLVVKYFRATLLQLIGVYTNTYARNMLPVLRRLVSASHQNCASIQNSSDENIRKQQWREWSTVKKAFARGAALTHYNQWKNGPTRKLVNDERSNVKDACSFLDNGSGVYIAQTQTNETLMA